MNLTVDLICVLWREDSGQDLVEYAFIVGLIALASIAAMSNLAHSLASLLNAVGDTLVNAT
jgi:Flp pilus assembly pilin Flp